MKSVCASIRGGASTQLVLETGGTATFARSLNAAA
jgi:hypothetical protein